MSGRLSSGIFWDKFLLVATGDGILERRFLGFDWLGAPEIRAKVLRIRKGDSFAVKAKRRKLSVGQVISSVDFLNLHNVRRHLPAPPDRLSQ